jgi:hypothetical protein
MTNDKETVILAEEEGKFGKVRVIDEPYTRSLYINNQLQGRVHKSPNAQDWEPNCSPGVGALSNNVFVSSSVLLGCQVPQGSGLILGLGCGAGIMMNLACFPQMRLTVVEIDPVIIKLCLTFFPLIDYYKEQGRLQIIEADAETFLRSRPQGFDFIQFDVAVGENNVPSQLGYADFIELMQATAPILSANLISTVHNPHFLQFLDSFETACQSMVWVYPTQAIFISDIRPISWFVFNRDATVPRDFVPFPHLSSPSIDSFRRNFAALQDGKLSLDHLKTR